jgi:hypothetical protein
MREKEREEAERVETAEHRLWREKWDGSWRKHDQEESVYSKVEDRQEDKEDERRGGEEERGCLKTMEALLAVRSKKKTCPSSKRCRER